MTYFGKWSFVEEKEDITAIKTLYMAPGQYSHGYVRVCIIHASNILLSLFAELQTLNEATEASDWWSLGAFLFELLTGKVYNVITAIRLLLNYAWSPWILMR